MSGGEGKERTPKSEKESEWEGKKALSLRKLLGEEGGRAWAAEASLTTAAGHKVSIAHRVCVRDSARYSPSKPSEMSF